jgi:hypothetical protein
LAVVTNYVAEVANALRREIEPELLPDGDVDLLFLFYAVLAMTRGVDTTAEDVHDAWTAWMTATGQDHEAMKPYTDLPSDVQDEDVPYVRAIRDVARLRATGF